MLTLPLDSSLICPDVFAEHLILAAELDFALLSLSAISLRASIDAADDASYDAYIVTPDSLMVAALEASALTVIHFSPAAVICPELLQSSSSSEAIMPSISIEADDEASASTSAASSPAITTLADDEASISRLPDCLRPEVISTLDDDEASIERNVGALTARTTLQSPLIDTPSLNRALSSPLDTDI